MFAKLRRCNPHIKGEDACAILLTFNENTQVIIDGNRLLDHSSSNTRRTMGELEIAGTRGTIRLDGEGSLLLRKHGEQAFVEQSYAYNDQNFGGDCVFNTIEHMLSITQKTH